MLNHTALLSFGHVGISSAINEATDYSRHVAATPSQVKMAAIMDMRTD